MSINYKYPDHRVKDIAKEIVVVCSCGQDILGYMCAKMGTSLHPLTVNTGTLVYPVKPEPRGGWNYVVEDDTWTP